MVKIDAPLLEAGCFSLSNSCCIDFEQSTFMLSIRHLTVMTHCIAAPQPGLQAASPWTFQNILVHFPRLEEALIGVHGIEPISDNLPTIEWPMLRKLTLMLEPGIVKFVSHIAFLAIECACIIFPVWQIERVWLEEDHLEGNNIKDQDQDPDDGSKQGSSDSEEVDDEEYNDRDHRNIIDIMMNISLGIALCYKQESEAFQSYFPHVPLIRCSNTQFKDQYCFDEIPPDGFDAEA